ncbi:MAG: hypothetical protein ACP5H3_03540, partial [Candidatus Aenigmatarchaeota archaeon]
IEENEVKPEVKPPVEIAPEQPEAPTRAPIPAQGSNIPSEQLTPPITETPNLPQETPQQPTPPEPPKPPIETNLPETGKVSPNERIRGTWKTIIQPGRAIPEKLQETLKEQNPYYEISPNASKDIEALRYITENGVEKALNYLEKVKEMDIDLAGMIGGRLIQIFAEMGDFEKALEAEKYTEELLRAGGRAAERIKLWSNTTPRLVQKIVENYAKKYGKVVPPEFKDEVVKRATEILQISDLEQRKEAFRQLAKTIAKQFPLSKGELFNLYRYTNMLSGPQTHERNSFWNIFVTFIGRPLDLTGAKIAQSIRQRSLTPLKELQQEIPAYIAGTIKGFGEAVEAFKNTLAHDIPEEKFLETLAEKRGSLTEFEAMIEAERYKKAPRILTIIPDSMEGADHFFATLIKTGEKARLMKEGISEIKAIEEADKLAEKILVREKLDSKADGPKIARALDAIGESLLELRKKPIIGPVAQFFIPFIRTPVDVGKAYIERTPMSAWGAKTDEEWGRIIMGSLMMTIGAILALKGDTTWRAPTDPEAKSWFYAARKKPYSVRIGNNYIPMWYFGPYGLALMIPAMLKYHLVDKETALTESTLEKLTKSIGDIAYAITEQTPLSAAQNFYKVLSGDVDIKSFDALGFSVEQLIPFDSALRWVAQIIDPVYRKITGEGAERFVEQIEKDIPFLSMKLKSYPAPIEEAKQRNWTESFLPYGISKEKPEFISQLEKRMEQLKIGKKLSKEAKELTEEYYGKQEVPLEKTLRAKALYSEILNLPTYKEKIARLTQIKREDPEMFQRIYDLYKANKLGLTARDMGLKALNTKERALELKKIFDSLPDDNQRTQLWYELIRKGVITKEVAKYLYQIYGKR